MSKWLEYLRTLETGRTTIWRFSCEWVECREPCGSTGVRGRLSAHLGDLSSSCGPGQLGCLKCRQSVPRAHWECHVSRVHTKDQKQWIVKFIESIHLSNETHFFVAKKCRQFLIDTCTENVMKYVCAVQAKMPKVENACHKSLLSCTLCLCQGGFPFTISLSFQCRIQWAQQSKKTTEKLTLF